MEPELVETLDQLQEKDQVQPVHRLFSQKQSISGQIFTKQECFLKIVQSLKGYQVDRGANIRPSVGGCLCLMLQILFKKKQLSTMNLFRERKQSLQKELAFSIDHMNGSTKNIRNVFELLMDCLDEPDASSWIERMGPLRRRCVSQLRRQLKRDPRNERTKCTKRFIRWVKERLPELRNQRDNRG